MEVIKIYERPLHRIHFRVTGNENANSHKNCHCTRSVPINLMQVAIKKTTEIR